MENLIYSAVLQLQACSLGSPTLMTWPDPSSHQQVCVKKTPNKTRLYLLSVHIPSLNMHKVMLKNQMRTIFFSLNVL